MSRSCDNCTACCEGWLSADIYGYAMYPGKPCFFMKKDGCSIYLNRPKDPCHEYRCAWLVDETLPYWFKPDISGVICTWREWKPNSKYLEIKECGKKIESEILSWIFMFHINTKCNIRYELSGGWNVVGEQYFVKYFLS